MSSPAPAIRIVVADDHQVVRTGFAELLGTQPDFAVLGTACDGAEAVRVCRELRPDVVLMDVRMPRMDGIAATREIISADKEGPRVLILTTFDLDEYVFSALRAGAGGFLLKDTPPDDLVTAIRVIASGEALLAPTVTRRLIEEFARRPEPATAPHQSLEGVTEREREVLVLIGRGLSNGEIAAHLHVAAATVKTHVSRLLMKLCARDRAQLVIAAYESGLLGTTQ
jgi:DNA-binding NarL/FixJ family response regulator